MLDLQSMNAVDTPVSGLRECYAHCSNQALHEKIRTYCLSVADLGFRRKDVAFAKARETDHCALVIDSADRIQAISVPIPQTYVSGAAPWLSVPSPVEILFHQRDTMVGHNFLTEVILSRQAILLKQRYEGALIYTVIREAYGYAGILRAHGWEEFEPETGLVLCREQTGALYRADERWFRMGAYA